MNGPHDIGGLDGFGPITPEPNEPLFHAPWEARAMAITIAAGAGGSWTIDESRHRRENRNWSEYHSLSYYALWLTALESLLKDHGLVTAREIAAGHARDETAPPNAALRPADVPATLARGGPTTRDPGTSRPKFAPGQKIRTLNLQPRGHIRLPAYARDKPGTITAIRDFHVFPDASATGDRTAAAWLYTVRFAARDLWGDDAAPGDSVTIDAWEPYLVAR